MSDTQLTLAILWRGDAEAERLGIRSNERLRPVFERLEQEAVCCVPVVYRDEIAQSVGDTLIAADGVLVWVDPIHEGRGRATLDALLRQAAENGVWLSAHPDVIARMGTKAVLYRTKSLGWGTDTHLYATADEFRRDFPARLRNSGPRVLKPNRGNGGIGIWKVELPPDRSRAGSLEDPLVLIHEARIRDTVVHETTLASFISQCERYFADGGPLIDQAFQPTVTKGLIRVYFVADEVVGFSRQRAESLLTEPGAAARVMGLPSPKTMYPPTSDDLKELRANLNEWIPAMQELVGVSTTALPLLWDADFLLGPSGQDGAESYVLCEINASCVTPFPQEAVDRLAELAIARASESRKRRAG